MRYVINLPFEPAPGLIIRRSPDGTGWNQTNVPDPFSDVYDLDDDVQVLDGDYTDPYGSIVDIDQSATQEDVEELQGEVEVLQAEIDVIVSGYIHNQSSPSAVWTIVHNLNAFPSVTIVDSGGTNVFGGISYTNMNQVVVTFSAAFSGKAYLR